MSKRKCEDKPVQVLAVIGLVIALAYLMFYFVSRDQGAGSYTILFILLFMLLPIISLIFFIVDEYQKALSFLIVQSFLELLLNTNIIHWSWLLTFLLFLALVIPQFIILRHIKQPDRLSKAAKNTLIIIFFVLILIYGGFVIFALWSIFEPDVQSSGLFASYILYLARYSIHLICCSCIAIMLFKHFTVNKVESVK